MDDYTGSGQPAAAPRTKSAAGYCQECGRALTADTIRRTVHGVFCQPCSLQRPGVRGGWQTVPSQTSAISSRGGAAAGSSGTASPFLAGWLGAIPGVGAMYNGQYAKAALHLLVFVILVSLADNLTSVFYWLVWGWVFYQIFDAYHTARARRDGLPLPNPFGWNEVGERLGFGRATPPPPVESHWSARTAEPSQASPFAGAPPVSTPRPAASGPYGKGPEAYQPLSEKPYAVPFAAASEAVPPVAQAQASYMSSVPYRNTYLGEVPAGSPAGYTKRVERRFPLGALWLIGLGVLFLLGNMLPNFHLNGRWLVPVLLGVVALWAAFRRLNQVRSSLGPAQIVPGIARAVTGPAVLFTLAVLLGVDSADVLSIRRSWPLLLVVWGAMLLAQRLRPASGSDELPELSEGASLGAQETPGTGTFGL